MRLVSLVLGVAEDELGLRTGGRGVVRLVVVRFLGLYRGRVSRLHWLAGRWRRRSVRRVRRSGLLWLCAFQRAVGLVVPRRGNGDHGWDWVVVAEVFLRVLLRLVSFGRFRELLLFR